MSEAKTGWAPVNPSREACYEQDVRIDSLPAHEPGWVHPALFNTGTHWILISETAPDRDYAGTRLEHLPGSSEFEVGFPQDPEVLPGGPLGPQSTLPWKTPWWIVVLGEDLEDIVESTLGTDLAGPSVLADGSFVRPGRAAWNWALLKGNSVNYKVQRRFIDFAAEMGWEYCLIDVNWDTEIGYERVEELVSYAREKGVGIFLWYNSSGDWNSTPYHPKSELLTEADRERVTSNGFELALAVLFQSGVQHCAVLPEAMERMPDYVRSLMREIPVAWDETRLVDGYPGEWVALARRTGDTSYMSGGNGTGQAMEKEVALPFIDSGEAVLATDGPEPRSFR